MNAQVPFTAHPYPMLRRALGNLLPVRYLRALSSSARISLALLAGVLAAIVGLRAFSGPPLEAELVPEAIPVVVRAVRPRSIAPQVHVFGRVENPNTTTLRASTLAYVSEVNVREGQDVVAGEVLLRLDDRDAGLALKRSEAALTEARGARQEVLARQAADLKNADHQRRLLALTVRKQERFRTLFGNGQISATDYDTLERQRIEMEMAVTQQEMRLAMHDASRASAEARVARAEADFEQARLELERLTLRAPFAGTITAVEAAIGARLDAGQAVVTLFSAESQRVRVSLAETDARALREARQAGAEITAAARVAGAWVPLAFLEIASQVRSGRAGTDVLFDAPVDGRLALGRAVDVKITLPPRDDVLEVPVEGVYADRIVYTVQHDELRAVPIERIGVREDEAGRMNLLVRAEGLDAGDPLVVSSLSRAASGTRVRIIAADPTAHGPDRGSVEQAIEAAPVDALAKR